MATVVYQPQPRNDEFLQMLYQGIIERGREKKAGEAEKRQAEAEKRKEKALADYRKSLMDMEERKLDLETEQRHAEIDTAKAAREHQVKATALMEEEATIRGVAPGVEAARQNVPGAQEHLWDVQMEQPNVMDLLEKRGITNVWGEPAPAAPERIFPSLPSGEIVSIDKTTGKLTTLREPTDKNKFLQSFTNETTGELMFAFTDPQGNVVTKPAKEIPENARAEMLAQRGHQVKLTQATKLAETSLIMMQTDPDWAKLTPEKKRERQLNLVKDYYDMLTELEKAIAPPKKVGGGKSETEEERKKRMQEEAANP